MRRLRVAVAPASARTELGWVFTALEEAYPVSFVYLEPEDLQGHTAAILFLESSATPRRIPGKALVYALDRPGDAVRQPIVFPTAASLDRRLRGRTLREESLPLLRPLDAEGAEVLATAANAPVWVRKKEDRATTDVVRLPAAAPKAPLLRENMTHGRFFFLLTLVHFLYDLLGEVHWTPPPLRAALVVDDPNLRALSYGFLRFPAVAAAARKYRFHLSVAVSAIDLAATSRSVARFMRDHADVLSVSMHGNDHMPRELLRPADEAGALPGLLEMLRRVEAFEAEHHLAVSRVLVPPWELFSAAVLRALRRLPVLAVTSRRIFPWRPPSPWSDLEQGGSPLMSWGPGDFVEGGMAIIRRSSRPDNIVFRAFLNQPVIHFFHAFRFGGDMEDALTTVGEVNSLGDVQWGTLDHIARTNVISWRDGATLHVRLFSRRVEVGIPAGATTVCVDVPPSIQGQRILCSTAEWGERDGRQEVPVRPGSLLSIRVVDPVGAEAGRGSPAGRRTAAWLHRRLGEAADRMKLRRS